MICSLCAAENPIDGRYCLKCGALLQGQREFPPQPVFQSTVSTPYTGAAETDGKAVGSLICGLMFFFLPVAIVAVVLGHISLGEIRRSGGRLRGSGMATAGLVLGYTGVSIIPIMIIAAIAIPNLLRARIAANEASAIGSMRSIEAAAFTYSATYSNGFPADWSSLGRPGGPGSSPATCEFAHLIDWTLESGQKDGYRFRYIAPDDPGVRWPPVSPEAAARGCRLAGRKTFEVHADPITRGTTGQRSFFSDQTGVIRFSEEGPATAASEVLQ